MSKLKGVEIKKETKKESGGYVCAEYTSVVSEFLIGQKAMNVYKGVEVCILEFDTMYNISNQLQILVALLLEEGAPVPTVHEP